MTPKRPSNVNEITVDIKVTDRHHNEHTATVEVADYETVGMLMKRVEAALERVLTEVP